MSPSHHVFTKWQLCASNSTHQGRTLPHPYPDLECCILNTLGADSCPHTFPSSPSFTFHVQTPPPVFPSHSLDHKVFWNLLSLHWHLPSPSWHFCCFEKVEHSGPRGLCTCSSLCQDLSLRYIIHLSLPLRSSTTTTLTHSHQACSHCCVK